ncbi:hypothetical protein [Streptomyces massasporeus]
MPGVPGVRLRYYLVVRHELTAQR